MIKPYKLSKDSDVYAVVSVNMDAACPAGADISVQLVQGFEGAKRVASIAYAKLVADNAYYIRNTDFKVGFDCTIAGSLSDMENGVGVVKCIKVDISPEDTELPTRFELNEKAKE